MNTYSKFAPNVFVAKCTEEHEKGETIILTTKYGKEHECTVFNLVATKDDHYYYSIVRNDGFNAQEYAKKKAERLQSWGANAAKRSSEAYKKSDLSEGATGIPFGQPILIGHHSERRHRKVIERADNAMRKSVEESRKAEDYLSRAEYWERKANTINLSMPESVEFYEYKLEEAKKVHKYLKDNPDKRAHSFSLAYANKDVKELQKKVNLAVKLWGEEEDIKLLKEEQKETAKSKASKKVNALIEKYGGFFAFSKDQFKEGHAKLLESGHIEEGEKVSHVKHGLYIPSKHFNEFIAQL